MAGALARAPTVSSPPFAGIAHRRRLDSSTSSTPKTAIVARSSSSSSSSSSSPITPSTPVTEAEEEANNKRWQESGGGAGSSDAWRWTLNWDEILPGQVFVGSCPRSASDVDELVRGTGATAILCLQSDLCLEALQIDWRGVTGRADALGVLHARAAVRDFDHGDQAFMLPEAVRLLASLLELGEVVYVHCTAGINRASLAVVGYLTFARGQPLERALGRVRERRAQANPYVDCWRTVRSRALDGRGEEVAARAKARYLRRSACEGRGGGGGGGGGPGGGGGERLFVPLDGDGDGGERRRVRRQRDWRRRRRRRRRGARAQGLGRRRGRPAEGGDRPPGGVHDDAGAVAEEARRAAGRRG